MSGSLPWRDFCRLPQASALDFFFGIGTVFAARGGAPPGWSE